MRAVIIDDESLAREELGRLLVKIPDLEVVGEASNGPAGIELIEKERPDLVFLDIEMPGMTGFEMLERLTPPVPEVIFTTAYEEFSIKAFRVNALDYLLKPIDPAQLEQAVAKLQEQEPAADEMRAKDAKLKPEDRVFVRDGARCWFVKVSNIRLLESEGNYTRLYIGTDKPMIYRPLKAFQARLDPASFFRANRHQIINLHNVDSVSYNERDELVANMQDGTKVCMSRRMAQQFREQMGI